MFRTAQYLIVVLLFTVFNLLFTIPAYAQESRQDLHNWTQNVMIEVMSSMTCQLAGVDPVNPSQKCLGIANGKIGHVDSSGGAVGVMGNLIAMTFDIPAHSGDYFRYLAGNFGISKPAYAQQGGIGFSGLSPLTDIWVAFRNIVYLLFVLVFVIIGFAIMFRVKIDPRTVMTIENQIPKIIIGLILVTFSFAIAGLLIDLMWVFTYLVIEVFKSIDPTVARVVTNFQGQNVLETANNLQFGGSSGYFGVVEKSAGAVGGLVSNLFNGTIGNIVGIFITGIMSHIVLIATPLGKLLNAGKDIPVLGKFLIDFATGTVVTAIFGSKILGFVGSLIAFLVIGVAVLWALFRLWFTLIKAYVFILIDVVFAPFWIIAGLVPGSNLSFSAWLRDIGANLIAFPATIVIFLLGQAFINKFGATQTEGQFVPPLIGNPGDTNAIGALIGLGTILLAPTVVEMMKGALKAPKFDLTAIATAIGVGTGVANIPTSVGRIGMEFTYATHLPLIGGTLEKLGQLGRRKPPAAS